MSAYGGATVAIHGRSAVLTAAADALGLRVVDGPADAIVLVLGEDSEAGDPAIVIAARERLDEAAALYPDAEWLCEPSPADVVGALLTVLARRGAHVADPARDHEAERLRTLSEDASRIARALAAIADESASRPFFGDRARGYRGPGAPEPSAGEVRAAIRARRLRERFFPAELFADPAWDMLLDLMAARSEKEGVAVSSLCIAAHVPPTTALRWIKALTDQGLFVRRPDPSDKRRVFIALSDEAAHGMAGWFAACAAA